MTFEEFKNKYGELFGVINITEYGCYNKPIEMCGCKIEWRVGGITGGSCWGTDHYPCDVEDEPNFDQLDSILEKLSPTISFLQYKKICSAIIKVKDYTQDEYYGNSYNYRQKYFAAEDLFNSLKEMSLL